MRTIDADAFKEYIDSGHLRRPTQPCFSEADVVSMIDKQPTVGDWIPVSERLPEEFDLVITCSEFGEIEFGSYEKGKWYWLAESHSYFFVENNDEVVAWMPLPGPWKGEDNEND